MARCLSIGGIAREVAALTGTRMRPIPQGVVDSGPAIRGQVNLDIRERELNPRFTLALIKGVEIKPSPEWIQRRLRMAGMRPINNIVDITNYVMLETGQPLHAFDFDVLVERAGGKAPTVLTRLPESGEKLTTLDGVERTLDPFTILVCDQKGSLSLGGIMGGLESEIYDASTGEEAGRKTTTNVLLEAAAWNFINIRKTLQAQRERGNEISSEAGYRFSRGVHPSMARVGLLRAIQMMLEVGGGQIAEGILDEYPLPAPTVEVDLMLSEVKRLLGMDIDRDEIIRILTTLEFIVEDQGESLRVIVPDHRMDMGLPAESPNQDIAGQVAQADLIEDIVRVYGYDRVPETMIADVIPPQHDNPSLKGEETARDLLVRAGLQEIVSYRLTTPEAEDRLSPPGGTDRWNNHPYVTLANPISQDKAVMRQSLLAGMLTALTANTRWRTRQALFEIGKVYWLRERAAGESPLPEEPERLCIAMTGERSIPAWQESGTAGELMDYFDLKGVIETLLEGLHVGDVSFTPFEHSSFFPGRTALLKAGKHDIGLLGELHPLVREAYGLPEQPVLVAELNLDVLIGLGNTRHPVHPVSNYPAIYQDIAVVVDETAPAADIEAAIREAGGWMLVDVRLFDVFRGEKIGASKKSLAYGLTFQAADRTLKDKDADKQRERIVRTLEAKFGAKLRD
jgi:phenylalanyl-tRNA synthetase beta chain